MCGWPHVGRARLGRDARRVGKAARRARVHARGRVGRPRPAARRGRGRRASARAGGRSGLRFHALRVAVEAGPSVQASARRARYRALLDLAALLGERDAVGRRSTIRPRPSCSACCAERASPASPASSAPRGRRGAPVIDCRRDEVAAFARVHCAGAVNDPSNQDSRFLRTRVRNEILPLLVREDPGIAQHVRTSRTTHARRRLCCWNKLGLCSSSRVKVTEALTFRHGFPWRARFADSRSAHGSSSRLHTSRVARSSWR